MAAAVRKHRGDVCVAALIGEDAPYIRAVKSDLISHFREAGEVEWGCELRICDGVGYIDRCDTQSLRKKENVMHTMTVAELCQSNDLSVQAAENALANLQDKGLITGFVPGELHAQIVLTAEAAKYHV